MAAYSKSCHTWPCAGKCASAVFFASERRGGRAVEGGRLESVCADKIRTPGSNPGLSAIVFQFFFYHKPPEYLRLKTQQRTIRRLLRSDRRHMPFACAQTQSKQSSSGSLFRDSCDCFAFPGHKAPNLDFFRIFSFEQALQWNAVARTRAADVFPDIFRIDLAGSLAHECNMLSATMQHRSSRPSAAPIHRTLKKL